MKLKDRIAELSFRVVVYHDGEDWVAHSLELDIVGCGDDPQEALEELIDAIEAQVTFALQTGDPSLIRCRAPEEVEEMWTEASERGMEDLFSPRVRRGHPDTGEPEGPLAKYLSLRGRELDKMRGNRMEFVCG